ncbi:hypothetical protein ADIWIN_3659 [Winogradskyella psychrotolerans RS-3]|uniref:Uncharacterized protein n=1 Tax=Winogradskyella psychrotolerans RS-3 TaxID=641526 RepID=S7X2G0_9FLAO|nr:hypothetical protein [Winogradskyella psychrotolerans]EPR70303.1 hypothetical protein ADIWIN_3659 [Winogradskyella psychrotolerans RS-3]
MRILKRILNYSITTGIALLFAFAYMRIILGPKSKDTDWIAKFSNIVYDLAFVYASLILGCIIAVLYILIDVLYTYKKLKNNTNATRIRLLILISLAIVVTATHYILEKVIDVI